MRRRRHRTSFRRSTISLPGGPQAILAVAGLLFVAAFVFFYMRADQLAPAPQETRIDLPNAFK